jgi:hypothetical protein
MTNLRFEPGSYAQLEPTWAGQCISTREQRKRLRRALVDAGVLPPTGGEVCERAAEGLQWVGGAELWSNVAPAPDGEAPEGGQ